MNSIAKGMLLVFVVIYIISPVDLCPGPIDDLIVLIISMAAQKRIGNGNT